MALIKGVNRIQGLLVRRGNPSGINGFEDLAREGIKFVNRQRGSGTRLLLDYYLKKLEINPEDILGYEREEFTHLAVAAAVAQPHRLP
jgi:putative molybdopterin biosynthesis protein